MKFRLAMVGALGVAMAAVVLAEGPGKVDLTGDLALAQQYEKYAHPAVAGKWEKGDVLPTAKKEDEAAWSAEGGTISIDKEGMKVVGNPGVGCYVTLAKKTFKGPIGIRYEAMTPQGMSPCDLSVRFGPADSDQAVAFAFGGMANNQDFLTVGKARNVLAGAPMIVPGRWHTVECLLGPDSVIGRIDGQTIGEQKLDAPLKEETEHDVALYVWATTGVFRNVQVMRYVVPKGDARPWEEAMGKTTKEQLKAMASKMVPLLGNDDFTTRDTAEQILRALRPLSEDAVREALKATDPEAKHRAERLGRELGLIKEAGKARPAETAPAPAQEDLPGGGIIFPGNIIIQGGRQ